MSTPIVRRTLLALIAGAALLLAALAAAPQAQAAVIYVCVKKSSGEMRLVGRSTHCKRSEKKLSWNATGPAGKDGANGSDGKEGEAGSEGRAGANGAVAGFSAIEEAAVPLNEYVLTKKLPAGHYVISAAAQVFGRASAAGKVVLGCELDVDGHEAEGAQALVPLLETGAAKFEVQTPLTTQVAVTLSAVATIGLYCYDIDASVTLTEGGANHAVLDALQVNSLS